MLVLFNRLRSVAMWAATARAELWNDMDYGPFLTATIEVAPENIAYKAIAIRLDDGPGGISKGRAFVAFDTDTLRYAAGWTGEGFIDWKNVAFDGSHTTHPVPGRTARVCQSGRPGLGAAARRRLE